MAASIITSVKGDVTYDGIPDTVSLIGVQFGDSNAWQQMSLVIQNGATGRITAIALPDDAAYAPSISLVSLTGKDKRDILLSLPTGGSGGIIDYIIYTYDDGTRHTHHGRGRGRDLLAALANLFDQIHGFLKTVVLYTYQQGGVARPQKAAGGGQLGDAKAVVHQLSDQTGRILILYDSNDQFHPRSSSLMISLSLASP